jgi:penicillin-insensitive murein endopeptidase
MSQPRGGPMTFGHASHQIGLDVDIWYRSMPDHALSRHERDDIQMSSVLTEAGRVDPDLWTARHVDLIRRAASDSAVARIFVHPAIKKSLCETPGGDRSFLKKVRPFWGHDDHFHVRLSCPSDNADCQPQPVVANDEGCGKELDHWLKLVARPQSPAPAAQPGPQPSVQASPVAPPSKNRLTAPAASQAPKGLDRLPAQCRVVLASPPGGEVIVSAVH